MERQRYWIERSFQDVKNEVGVDEYQVRKYDAFYHHMSPISKHLCFGVNPAYPTIDEIKEYINIKNPGASVIVSSSHSIIITPVKFAFTD